MQLKFLTNIKRFKGGLKDTNKTQYIRKFSIYHKFSQFSLECKTKKCVNKKKETK